MTRPVIPDFIRVSLVALGVCALAVAVGALWTRHDWRKTEGVVEVSQVVEYGRTNMQTRVAYSRANGLRMFLFSSAGIPLTAQDGDRLPVLYDPKRGKNGVVYCFDTVWRVPVYAALLGIFLTSMGLFARGRLMSPPNQTLDRMARTAVPLLFEAGRAWRAPPHRSARQLCMPSRHSHPLIQQIDAGLDTLDPVFNSFAKAQHYDFSKSVDGDFNPPKRRLDRLPRRRGFHQIISLQIVGRDPETNAPPEFGQDMPCTLTAFASVLVGERWKCLRRQIFSALPFSEVRSELSLHLQTAHHQLDEWTCEKIVTDGGEE